MENIIEIIKQNENTVADQVLHEAFEESGTITVPEHPLRSAVQYLSQALVMELSSCLDNGLESLADSNQSNHVTAFADQVVRRHRRFGVEISEFFSLLKMLRRHFLQIVEDSDLETGAKGQGRKRLELWFDRLEVIFSREWMHDKDEEVAELHWILSIKNRIADIFITHSGNRIYKELMAIILEAVQSPIGIFGHLNDRGDLVISAVSHDAWLACKMKDRPVQFPGSSWGGLWGKALTEGQPQISNTPLDVPGGHVPVERALCVPILLGGVIIGMIAVGNKKAEYGGKDVQMLTSIADRIAPILHAQLEKEREEKELAEANEERRLLEERLMQAQKGEALVRLASGVAHDFSNLLTGVMGHVSLVRMDLPAGSEAARGLDEAGKALLKASELSRQMLAFSGKGYYVLRTIDLSEMVWKLDRLFHSSLVAQAEIRYRLTEKLPTIEADENQLRQVLLCLVTNAAEAIGEDRKGLIGISTGVGHFDRSFLQYTHHGELLEEGVYVYLRVEDNGCGMDDTTCRQIFEPFFSTKFTGRGLGLAAVSGILRAHGGAVHVRTKLGQGSVFTVIFPLKH